MKALDWSANFTSDDCEECIDQFYETDLFKLLVYRVKNYKCGLMLLRGLQGVGKSRFLLELNRTFPYAIRIKFTKDWREKLMQAQAVLDKYYESIESAYKEIFIQENAAKHLMTVGEVAGDTEIMNKKIGKGRCKDLHEQALKNYLEAGKLFLIDMPDYTRKTAASMNGDIMALQEFWGCTNQQNCLLIVTAQKELIDSNPHFFWGKFMRETLKPLTPDELIQVYSLNCGNDGLFDEAALRLLGELSRGVLRRFKNYVRMTIEQNINVKPLRADHVTKAITQDRIFEDMQQELSNVFGSEEAQRQALTVLDYLRGKNDANIKTISEAIGIGEQVAQKIILKLALYRYVNTKRGEGNEKLVSLQLKS